MRKWLVALRKAAGHTQADLAEMIGVSQPSYCNIEKGERRPSPKTAKALGRVLGFDWTRFYQEEEISEPV